GFGKKDHRDAEVRADVFRAHAVKSQDVIVAGVPAQLRAVDVGEMLAGKHHIRECQLACVDITRLMVGDQKLWPLLEHQIEPLLSSAITRDGEQVVGISASRASGIGPTRLRTIEIKTSEPLRQIGIIFDQLPVSPNLVIASRRVVATYPRSDVGMNRLS